MIAIKVDTLHEWRMQARELLKRGIMPQDVAWENKQQSLLLGADQQQLINQPIIHQQLAIPSAFFNLANNVACFRDDRKWSLLYSVAWRLLFEDKQLLGMAIDKQVSELLAMQKSVARDKHKMAAFVRFKRVDVLEHEPAQQGDNYAHYVAWFEPEHLIVMDKSPFFVRRFSNMSWSILTPDLCAHWDQRELTFTQGISRPPSIADDLEKLWLTYYQHIFNPARVKVKAMQSEMPKKYWKNLPESHLIKSLLRDASYQEMAMLDNVCDEDKNQITESLFVKEKQAELHRKRQSS
ncbi:TIGR03915 family putative DNA repair protein [Eionea flava]